MNSLQITLRLLTPAFAGAADTSSTDGIRPPTLKALLRFWWRALHPELTGAPLFAAEERLFGSTQVGQGLRVVPVPPVLSMSDPVGTRVGAQGQNTGQVYLGYGGIEYSKPERAFLLSRPRLKADQVWTFRLILPRRATTADEMEVKRALWLLNAFGGVGTRSRRGWGSVEIAPVGGFGTGFPSLADSTSIADLKARLQQGLSALWPAKAAIPLPGGHTEPQHTAFSPHATLVVSDVMSTWQETLNTAGSRMNEFHRELGARHKHRHEVSGPDFKARVGWLKTPPTAGTPSPWGDAFGLPHNGGITRPERKAVMVGVGPRLDGRRASPLFLSVTRFGKQYSAVFCWLPSLFLPAGMDIYTKPEGQPTTPLIYPSDRALEAFFRGTKDIPIRLMTWNGLAQIGIPGYQEVTW